LKSFRNEETFIRNQEIQEFLKKQELEGKFKVYFFDEAGTSLIPNIPYAWQTVGDTIEIPSKRSKRLNILGFMNRGNDGLFHFVESSVLNPVMSFMRSMRFLLAMQRSTPKPKCHALLFWIMHRFITVLNSKLKLMAGWLREYACITCQRTVQN
jgi:hypothetical protein